MRRKSIAKHKATAKHVQLLAKQTLLVGANSGHPFSQEGVGAGSMSREQNLSPPQTSEMQVKESNEWCAIEGNFFEPSEINRPDLNEPNQAMAYLIDVKQNDPEDPSIDENSASSVLELSLESGLECRWDSLEDEWHSNDNSIVALKKILLLE
jgi:hypothetical protein